jgi:hypothetical protein
MSEHEWGPDELLARLYQHAPAEDQPALAAIFGHADFISRTLPAYAVPIAVRACWLCAVAATATENQETYAPALWRAARAYLDEATMPMVALVAAAPDDARELDA